MERTITIQNKQVSVNAELTKVITRYSFALRQLQEFPEVFSVETHLIEDAIEALSNFRRHIEKGDKYK